MTADIIHPGHIKCIQWLNKRCDFLIVGLLSEKALEGYKKSIMSFDERKSILDEMRSVFDVVRQDSLNPKDNLKKYECDAIASGDGWEDEELKAIKELGIKRIDIPFSKTYSSKKIKELCKESY